MKYVAKFEKVSYEQFEKDWTDTFEINDTDGILKIYNNIQLPTRATKFSAGYDFKSPVNFTLEPNKTIKLPTGIRAIIDESWVLKIYPRSSLGFKYRLQLNNGTGIIDCDYAHSDNEGHIFIKLTNDTNEDRTLEINQGDGIVQGIFVEYGITVDDECENVRMGGIGSTGK